MQTRQDRTDSPEACDVCVAGAGPAGLALSSALIERGLDVTLLSPRWPAPWPNNYGAWLDELDLPRSCFSRIWDRALVRTRSGEPTYRSLERRYVRLDNDALRDHLLDRIERADEGTLSPVEGRARRVTHDAQGSLVHRADGPPIRASVAVDATGYPGTFVRRTGQREPGVQVAYGFTATFDRPPFETGVEHHTQSPPARHGGAMVLMDFDDAHLAKAPRRSAWKKREVATFLYAMGEGNGRDFFVEETSLVARPAIDYELLEERLHRRLRAAGLDYEDVRDEEFCRIPMGAELPDRDQRALAFGAAASMVHPASGYMIARMLGAAAPLAAEIDAALRRGLAPERVAARAWRRLWPEEAVRRRALYTYGMEVLLDLDAGATRRFFDAFFDLEEGRRRRYLAGTADPREVATMMLELFGSSSNALRWRLARPALGSAGTQLLRALSAR